VDTMCWWQIQTTALPRTPLANQQRPASPSWTPATSDRHPIKTERADLEITCRRQEFFCRDSLAPLALNFPLSVALSVQEHKWSYYMLAKQKSNHEKCNYSPNIISYRWCGCV
jgi:hypothetical protein